MTPGVTPSVFVLLSGLVLLPLSAVGQVQAAPLLGCPTCPTFARTMHT